MNEVTGGAQAVVSREEYCSTLVSIVLHNFNEMSEAALEGAAQAAKEHCGIEITIH